MIRWLRRPFARTFDLLSSEYGWSDDQILDLPLSRVRQARDVVLERHGEEHRNALLIAETSARVIASFIAGGPSAENHKQASRIRFAPDDPDEAAELPSSEAVRGLFGG